jgi:type VII secretion integral membrane protein EccD
MVHATSASFISVSKGPIVSSSAESGLARVTIASATRRVDVALPEYIPAANLLPGLLRHAGDDLPDTGQDHGGWVLRRWDGAPIDPAQTLAAQSLRDGEVLHLTPRYEEWPELDYDDVVDVIATEARRQVRTWTSAATRRAAIVVAMVASALMLALCLSVGPSWTKPATVMLVVSGALMVSAIALSRALGDSTTGAAVGCIALFFGFAGGLTVFNGDHPLLGGLGVQQFLAGSAVLIGVSVLCYAGVADRTQFFVAGVHAGLLGVIAGLIGLTDLSVTGVAGILVAVAVVLAPVLPLLSIRLGKLPVPALPTTTDDLLADQPRVPRPRVYASVRRSDELLTGMLIGNALVAAIGQVVLAVDGRGSALVLVSVVAGAMLLQARLFPTLRHRAALLSAGVLGVAAICARALTRSDDFRLNIVVPLLLLVICLVLAAGRQYQHRQPGPYLGRIADILDVMLVLAVVPTMCVLVGLVGYMRNLYG